MAVCMRACVLRAQAGAPKSVRPFRPAGGWTAGGTASAEDQGEIGGLGRCARYSAHAPQQASRDHWPVQAGSHEHSYACIEVVGQLGAPGAAYPTRGGETGGFGTIPRIRVASWFKSG